MKQIKCVVVNIQQVSTIHTSIYISLKIPNALKVNFITTRTTVRREIAI